MSIVRTESPDDQIQGLELGRAHPGLTPTVLDDTVCRKGGLAMPQHSIIAAALVEQRRADLRGQADRGRLAHSAPADRGSARPIRRRWWRPATRPARA
jgi:hypothetical protein